MSVQIGEGVGRHKGGVKISMTRSGQENQLEIAASQLSKQGPSAEYRLPAGPLESLKSGNDLHFYLSTSTSNVFDGLPYNPNPGPKPSHNPEMLLGREWKNGKFSYFSIVTISNLYLLQV